MYLDSELWEEVLSKVNMWDVRKQMLYGDESCCQSQSSVRNLGTSLEVEM